jgi:hypothetical protein
MGSTRALAADVAWAFGLVDRSGAKLTFADPAEAPARTVARVGAALDDVRPAAGAPSVGEVLRSLRALDRGAPRRVRRRLVAELEALVAQATHGRAKRQERRRILGELIVLFELEPALGIERDPDSGAADARLTALAAAVAGILRS